MQKVSTEYKSKSMHQLSHKFRMAKLCIGTLNWFACLFMKRTGYPPSLAISCKGTLLRDTTHLTPFEICCYIIFHPHSN